MKFSLGNGAAGLDEPVGKRRFAVVDMSNDAEVSDVFHIWGRLPNRSKVSVEDSSLTEDVDLCFGEWLVCI